MDAGKITQRFDASYNKGIWSMVSGILPLEESLSNAEGVSTIATSRVVAPHGIAWGAAVAIVAKGRPSLPTRSVGCLAL